MNPIKLSIVGGAGRLGTSIIEEMNDDFELLGILESSSYPYIGKTLRDAGLGNYDIPIYGPDSFSDIFQLSDVVLSATNPEAELTNAPIAVETNTKLIIGTTGFTSSQYNQLTSILNGKIPCVITSNFSIGMNFVFKILESLDTLPSDYETRVFEIHHSQKEDAPSGTALTIADIISNSQKYDQIIYDRKSSGKRKPNELEIVSNRIGGVPGIHEINIAGPNEMIKIEHTAFSRKAFANGALLAAKWLNSKTESKIYEMKDVLSGN